MGKPSYARRWCWQTTTLITWDNWCWCDACLGRGSRRHRIHAASKEFAREQHRENAQTQHGEQTCRDFFRLRGRISVGAILAEKLAFGLSASQQKWDSKLRPPHPALFALHFGAPSASLRVSSSWRSSKPSALRI